MPSLVTTTRYNNLQNRINAIMGAPLVGSPTTGYNQVVNSSSHSPVTTSNKITAAQLVDLYIDLARARTHQIGNSFTVDPVVVGDFLTNGSSTDKPEDLYMTALENLMTDIESNKFEIDLTSQASIGMLVSNTRSTQWNGTITHEVTVSFESDTARRAYFNAGGQIRFDASIDYSGTESKTLDWQSLLSNMGNIIFDYTTTSSSNGVGIGSSIGNYDLTTSYQLIYSRSTATYVGNNYQIYAKENSSNVISFRIEFNDTNSDSIDEDVKGVISSIINQARPDGSVFVNASLHDTVVLPSPTALNVSTL